jgi:low affinity Fe/Cu permease
VPKKRPRHTSVFDRFAARASDLVSGALFFIFCTALVVLWLPSYFLLPSLNTWQLIINTITTIITFLLVALLQNSQRRVEDAMNDKLDAIADGLADLMSEVAGDEQALKADIDDLRRAVGIELVAGE